MRAGYSAAEHMRLSGKGTECGRVGVNVKSNSERTAAAHHEATRTVTHTMPECREELRPITKPELLKMCLFFLDAVTSVL